MEMITAGGDAVTMSREADGDRFRGAVVGLGALGIVTSLSLDIVPAFGIRQYVYENLPHEQLYEHLTDIFASAYSVSLFTDWRSPRVRQGGVKQRGGGDRPPRPGGRGGGGAPAGGPPHPAPRPAPAHKPPQPRGYRARS